MVIKKETVEITLACNENKQIKACKCKIKGKINEQEYSIHNKMYEGD